MDTLNPHLKTARPGSSLGAGTGWGQRFFSVLRLFFCSVAALLPVQPLYAAPVSFHNDNWAFYDSVNGDGTAYNLLSSSAMTITAAGMDVWTNADEYGAYYLGNVEGDFVVTVTIAFQENTHPWAKAGIMVRDDITMYGSSDGYCIVAATPGNGYAFQWDSRGDGMLDKNQDTNRSTSYPSMLKLEKTTSGSRFTFTGYYSTDNGENWVKIREITTDKAHTLQDVGLFVSSHNPDETCTVRFEGFDTDNPPDSTSYKIFVSSGNNGAISPSTDQTVAKNDTPAFTIVPDSGYEIDRVTVDGGLVSLAPDNTYTFEPVDAEHTIHAEFSQLQYTVTASAGPNGSVSPSGTSIVEHGRDITVSVTPAQGYEVDGVTVDGDASATLTNDQYVFSNVTADHEIRVTFKPGASTPAAGGIPGCATNTATDYSDGFTASHFSLNNVSVTGKTLALKTGNNAIDPDNITIPFTQEVFVTFLYEGAGFVSDFGWMLKSDAVDADGNFIGWNKISESAKHPIFTRIYDQDDGSGGCCGGGDGVLDTAYGRGGFPTDSETELADYDDGTGAMFVVDKDGAVTPKDMKKSLGTIAGGTELVFFLTSNQEWTTTNADRVFFTKKEWNTDTYGACGSGSFNKIYQLGQAISESVCKINSGWLAQIAIDRMKNKNNFDVTLSGEYHLPVTVGEKYSHVIVGAPATDPNKWILGWEDRIGGGDADHNDLVFQVERRTGGLATLTSENAIVPVEPDAYFTAVTMVVYDNMPCPGKTEIIYSLSIDDGLTWVQITDWDKVYETDADKSNIINDTGSVTDINSEWGPGDPQYTRREVRIDFSEKGLTGRALRWKAQMLSDDETCAPEIIDVKLDGTVATNGFFSRAQPVIQTNVVYSGLYETPAISWEEKVLKGHLVASRRYEPDAPKATGEETTATDVAKLWDAGEVLSSTVPSARTIYYPDTSVSVFSGEIGTGNGEKGTFSGTFDRVPVVAQTVRITDTHETFIDEGVNRLTGDRGGTGTLDRSTGEYTLEFESPPDSGRPVQASYTYYNTPKPALSLFTPGNITNTMLGLNDDYIIPDGYVYDFDGDADYDEDDGDWLVNWVRGYADGSSTPKQWLLGPIDHSVPAVQVPPGRPRWYYGSAVTDAEKASFDTFSDAMKHRQTVVYAGSRDGMLHAFDGGKFRWGDNPQTARTENRGYFLWESVANEDGTTGLKPNYGSGEEMWAFIPANLISRLKNNRLGKEDQAYVDASPTLADVWIDKGWKTVLLCAQGNGGDTVTALDVTNPVNPQFLWEFGDPDLYRSRSSAAVAQIGRIQTDGETLWVAFFVSGKSADPSQYPSVYLVNIEDGSLIRRVYLDDDPENKGKGGVASGQPAIVDSDNNGYVDRVYVGSDKGYLYKIIIPDDPDQMNYDFGNCVINTDFSLDSGYSVAPAYQYQPIYAAPSVTVETYYSSTGEFQSDITIFFGTGDSPYYDENINVNNTRYHFYAYKDTAKKGRCTSGDASLRWYLELDETHRVFASAFSAAGAVYFGTSTSETEDPCESTGTLDNQGKIYALDIHTGQGHSAIVGNVRVSPLVDDEHLYVKTPDGSIAAFGSGNYDNPVLMGSEVSTAVRSWKEITNED